MTGLYGFHFEGYSHELIRLIHLRKLTFDHLFAPAWFIEAISDTLCRCTGFPDRWGKIRALQGVGQITFHDIIQALLRSTDPHVKSGINWILGGGGRRASCFPWAADARCGRSGRGRAGTQYNHDDTPRTYTTGGMSTEFDRRIALILEQEKFIPLTPGIVENTYTVYDLLAPLGAILIAHG